jgi:hypothetical protein
VSRRAATAIPLVLIAACAAAFVRTEQLKLRHSPVGNPHVHTVFSPGCAHPHCRAVADMRFKLRKAQVLSLAMVNSSGHLVKTLVSHRRYPGKSIVHATWDGTDASGARVPDGDYELRVTLTDGRNVTIPDPVIVDTVAPTVKIGKVQHGRTQLNIPYTRSKGPGQALVIVTRNGRVVMSRHILPHEFHLLYSSLGPGRYTVSVVGVDRAGNRTPNPPSFTVTIP